MIWDTPTYKKKDKEAVADVKGGRFYVYAAGKKWFHASFTTRLSSIAIPPYKFDNMDEAKRACEAYAEGVNDV